MESIIGKAIGWFKAISESTKELTSGNVAHKSCAIRGMANRSAEYLEKHKGNLSVIKWQTGDPKESDIYLVTTSSNIVRTSYWNNGCWLINDLPFSTLKIKAWCKLSDIKPYKEEQK